MKNTNIEEEIYFIKKVMEDSRRLIVADGKSFIFWGVIVTIGLLVTYFAVMYRWESNLSWFWPALIAFGWIFTIIIESRHAKRAKTITFASKIIAAVWISCGIAMTIVGFAGPIAGAYNSIYVSPIISIILGVGYAVSGFVFGKFWVSLLSIGWWIGAILMLFMGTLETILIMAAMMLLFQTMPGIILYYNSKKIISEQ